jgi:hypothetical protein
MSLGSKTRQTRPLGMRFFRLETKFNRNSADVSITSLAILHEHISYIGITSYRLPFLHAPASTMSFIASSVCTSATSSLFQCLSRPGPSRLAARLQPCSSCAKHIRHASSASTESSSTESDVAAQNDADVIDAQQSVSSQRSAPAAQGKGYDSWLRSVGRQFKDAPTSGPNWLGGNVVCLLLQALCSLLTIHHQPYPTNPTFRPPPPLSDTLREMIYQEYFFPDKHSAVPASQFASEEQPKTGNINQLSVKHGISKARIEAILRLKITEKEWEKSNKVCGRFDSSVVPSPLSLFA